MEVRSLLDADDHRIRAYQMLYASLAEPRLLHPIRAIGTGIVETVGGLNQHIQAHEQSKSVLRAIIIDNAYLDNIRAALRNRFVSLAHKHLFYFQVPVMQDVTHHNHIGFG